MRLNTVKTALYIQTVITLKEVLNIDFWNKCYQILVALKLLINIKYLFLFSVSLSLSYLNRIS